MNYIAHIHLAALTETSLVGNFMGDFVRGSQLEYLPDELRQGVRLHRKIDSFTDKHPEVMALKRLFPGALRRTSGICLDIWFDHLLLLHNHQYPPLLESQVFADFYQQLQSIELAQERFIRVKSSLLRSQWLQHYQQPETCLKALQTVQERLGNRLVFASQSYQLLLQNKARFEQGFHVFYPELMQFALDAIPSH